MKHLKKIIASVITLGLLLPLTSCNQAGGQGGYPKSTITIVCPWDAGGSSDGICRVVSEIGSAKDYFGVNMIVQNSGGAGGTVATSEFKNAKADGYTICQEAIGVFTIQPFVREVSYSIDDFIPVASLSEEPIIMIAGKNTGIKSLADLVAKDSVTYGFSGSGSLMELSQKRFFEMTKVNATGISYDGNSPTIAALLGGHIDVCNGHPGEVMQYIQSGDAIPLGIFGAERDPREDIKDIPTFKEQGYDVVMSVWKFMIVPKETPEDVVNVIKEKLKAVTSTEKYKEFCKANHLLPLQIDTAEMLKRINSEAEVNKALLGK